MCIGIPIACFRILGESSVRLLNSTLEAVKLGFFIIGPWASTTVETNDPTMISLAQIININIETYTLLGHNQGLMI